MRSLGKLFILIAVLVSILAVSALVIKDSDLFRDFVALKLSEVLDRTVSFSKLDIDIDVDQSITIEVDDVVIALSRWSRLTRLTTSRPRSRTRRASRPTSSA